MENNKLKFDFVGDFTDSFIDKPYKLLRINARNLSEFLKENYKKIYGVPNIEDLNNSKFSAKKFEEKRFDHVFEIGYISLLACNEDFSDAILLDGYRRLFTMSVPDFPIFVRVFNPKNISVVDELKLMHEYNFWKNFTRASAREYFDRGMSLFLFLKTGVNIHSIISEFEAYVRFSNINSEDTKEFDKFSQMFFENKYLFDDIKFIYALKNSKLSFTFKKKNFKDQKIPIDTYFYRDISEIRRQALLKNKDFDLNVKYFIDSFEQSEAAQELVVDYNESIQGDKLDKCRTKGNEHSKNYFLREVLKIKVNKTELEAKFEEVKIFETFKRKYIKISENKPTYSYGTNKNYINKFIEKLKIDSEYFTFNELRTVSIDADLNITHNDDFGIAKLILKEITTKKAHSDYALKGDYEYIALTFLDEKGKSIEYTASAINSKGVYIAKENAEIKPKIKRKEFYIIEYKPIRTPNTFKHLVDWEGDEPMKFYVKAKTKSKVCEIINDKLSTSMSIQHMNDYCHDLTHFEKLVELMKDYPECISYGRDYYGIKNEIRLLKELL